MVVPHRSHKQRFAATAKMMIVMVSLTKVVFAKSVKRGNAVSTEAIVAKDFKFAQEVVGILVASMV